MKINPIEKSRNALKFELAGEGHTFCNALQEMLLKDTGIDFAGYEIAHPLQAEPTIYVQMKGRKKPERALIEASKKLDKYLTDLQKTFRKALQTIEKSS